MEDEDGGSGDSSKSASHSQPGLAGPHSSEFASPSCDDVEAGTDAKCRQANHSPLFCWDRKNGYVRR
ncbi:hypothetical protein ANCDUO_00898 [Ancylostoma duodenale]|uniref:Uncharacterized protein n=1 Tax=Ancylostoma duodenale TaxID=51022 RepID=A0A0C2E0A2_9BILA|nr:hypothetical protein ANCDUO_00898 [Ancylostoma duodenale]